MGNIIQRLNQPACIVLISYLFAACKIGANIIVSEISGDVVLRFEFRNREPACLDYLYVYDGDHFDKPVLQYAAPFGFKSPCLSQVTLRPSPAPSPDNPPPLHLVPGHRYVVAANGTGWTADTDFVAAGPP